MIDTDIVIQNILGRGCNEIDIASLSDRYAYQSVCITGAGGSIGSQLAITLAKAGASLKLFDVSEHSLWQLSQRMDVSGHQMLLGSIQNTGDCVEAMRGTDIVFHAAAYKHVPIVEFNPIQGIRNNAFGTISAIESAIQVGCSKFVMVSTDKAVSPKSIMGLTKRVAEEAVSHYGRKGAIETRCVRFGNVINSSGSVIPIFTKQIESGGPVTITHPDATRYMMTIPEACYLVAKSPWVGKSGSVLMLEMGEPVKIIDLARKLIGAYGLTEKEIPIKTIGLRPGEKLHESLSESEEALQETSAPGIYSIIKTVA